MPPTGVKVLVKMFVVAFIQFQMTNFTHFIAKKYYGIGICLSEVSFRVNIFDDIEQFTKDMKVVTKEMSSKVVDNLLMERKL